MKSFKELKEGAKRDWACSDSLYDYHLISRGREIWFKCADEKGCGFYSIKSSKIEELSKMLSSFYSKINSKPPTH